MKAFVCFCRFLSQPVDFEQESETSVRTGGFRCWPWACGTMTPSSTFSPHSQKKKQKKQRNLSKGILTCGSSMTILCHFPSSRILIRIMWCYKVAAESAFSGESRCLGSSAHSEENTYVTDVWSKSKWPVKSHVICRIIREWSEKSWQCPGLKRNTHMHTQTTKMYLKDSIRCTRTENAFGDA